MSYSKQNFRSGDTLYASQLNAMDNEIAALEAEVESTKNMVGSPLTASTAAGMTDQEKIYVYTGSETGYTAGHWYYHNGTAWTDGGVYNSVAVNTDTSLTVSGQAADSKAVGDAIDDLDSDLTDVKGSLNGKADQDAVNTSIAQTRALADSKAPAIVGTASGTVAHFESAVAGLPLSSVVTDIILSQAGTGAASPSNVRTITGHDSVSVIVSPTDSPLDGTTYTVTFPTNIGTVYGGTIDAATGKLTVTKIGFDPGDIVSMNRDVETDTRCQIRIDPSREANGLPKKASNGHVISNRYSKEVTANTAGYLTETSGYIYLDLPRSELADTSWTSIREWFANNPTVVVYEVETPIIYDVTPADIRTVCGDNYVSANTGAVSVVCIVDTQTYIDEKTNGIGNLADLDTTDNDTIVVAINEINSIALDTAGELSAKAPAICDSESGSVVHFTSDGSALAGLVANIVLSQSGSGTPALDNVRPITGYTGVNITISSTNTQQDGETVAVAFPTEAGTVYGGTIDILKGILIVTHVGINPAELTGVGKDSATDTIYTASIKYANCNIPHGKRYTSISNRFSRSLPSGTAGRIEDSSNYLYLKLPLNEMSDATKEAAQTWFENHPTTIVYEPDDPIVYNLTPQQVNSLVGDNYISADSGNVAVKVVVDTKDYVDDLFADNGIIVPSYFQGNLDTAIANYKVNEEEVGCGGQSFIFITDPHWGVNEKHSPDLIRYIVKNSNIRNVICGGDILDSGTKADELSKGYDFMGKFWDVPGGIKVVTGNHDYNKNQHGSDSSYWLTPNQAYSVFCGKNEMEIHDVNCCEPDNDGWQELSYYIDIPATKTRILFASIAYGAVFTVTKNWILSQLNDNPTLNFVIISHYLYGDSDYTTGVKSLFDAVKEYANLKTWIFGHTHYDMVDYLSTGIPLVCTDTDSSRLNSTKNPYTYTVGTITEQAFDIMTVNNSNRNVECVRVGRGKNRRVNGGINNVSGTKALTTTISSPTWTSSDTSVATVSNGTVTGVSAGSAIIKATGADKEEYWYVVVS